MAYKQIGWGVIGATSRIAGEAVIPAIIKCPGTRLVAVASRDRDRAAAVAAPFGTDVRAYGDYDSLLADPDVDVVYIPLPNNLHAGWAAEAMNNGKHVLCEQPLALNATEAQDMALTANENGVLLSEGYMYRYHPLQIDVLARIENGDIGTVSMVRAEFTIVQTEAADYILDPGMGGGALLDAGGFAVHVARSVYKLEPTAVRGQSVLDSAAGTDISTHAELGFPGQAIARINCSYGEVATATYQIIGDRGAIKVPHFCPLPGADAAYIFTPEAQAPQSIAVRSADMFEEEVCAMSDRIRGINVFLLSAEDGVNNMRVLDKIALSARSGGQRLFMAQES